MNDTLSDATNAIDRRERVKAGIAFLNVHARYDWQDCIDLEVLDLGSCGCCILGQLYGHYRTGVGTLHSEMVLQCEDEVSLGFEREYYEDYAALTEEWESQLSS